MAERLGNYRLLRHLATGGMGEVWLAEQEGPEGFRRRVVVKRLLRHLASDPSFVEMFVREARTAARIAHPNVAQIIELGQADGTYFLAMEYVRGRSLRDLLKKLAPSGEAIPVAAAILIAIGVLRGLHAAHTLVDDDGAPAGCVHRDVSAENVLLSVDGAVKLVDFGIAKALDASTARGTALRGKYGYMAPEQYDRARLDARTDIFACGVLLFELVTGERPFRGATAAETMSAVLAQAAPPLRSLVDCPARLDAIVARALAKAPEERFPDAEAMARELEAVLAAAPDLGDASATLANLARLYIDAPTAAGRRDEGAPRRTAAIADPEPAALADRARSARTRRRATVAAAGLAAAIGAVAFALHARAPAPTPVVVGGAPTAAASSASAEPGPPPPEPSTPPPETAEAPAAPTTGGAKLRAGTKAHSVGDRGVGTVEFRVRPWAEIFVDGRSVGLSPIAPLELPAGRHHVVLRNRNLDKERALTTNIVRGETTTVRVDLLE